MKEYLSNKKNDLERLIEQLSELNEEKNRIDQKILHLNSANIMTRIIAPAYPDNSINDLMNERREIDEVISGIQEKINLLQPRESESLDNSSDEYSLACCSP